MDKLQIILFGTPRIIINGNDIVPSHRKAIALIAYLALDRREHSRESLATFLFPDFDTSSGLGEIRRLLYSLNQCIGKQWIDTTRRTVALSPDLPIEVDLEQFNEFMLERHHHNHILDQVCVDCVPILLDAVELANGLFMEGYALSDSAEFDRWQQQTAIHYQHQLQNILDLLVRYYLHNDQPELGLPHARHLLALDPLREMTSYLLMLLEAKANRRSAALHYYDNLVSVLHDELDINPSQKVSDLAQAIRNEQPIDITDISSSVFIEERKFQRNLPTTTLSFIGRQKELKALIDYLKHDVRRLITIVGPGGIGKSYLSLMAGKHVENFFQDGVFFVPLAPLTREIDIVPAIAESIGYQFQQDERQQQTQLTDYLRNKHLLLIIDNFEHLVESGMILKQLLEHAPRVQMLVTSRQRLNQTGETIFPLQGLETPTHLLIERAEDYDAVQLFMYAAQQIQADFTHSQVNMQAIIEICQLVQGLPLAIILSASWLTMLTVEEISTEIKHGIDFLAVDMMDLPERQRSIRAVFDHSWNLLTEMEKQVFRQMAIFRGGFTRDAVETITDTTLHTIMSLTNKSLIQYDRTLRRYQLHELLRQYAEGKLLAAGDLFTTHHKHAVYYLNILVTHGSRLTGRYQLEALSLIEADYDNIKVAWQWAIEQTHFDIAESAIESLELFYQLSSRVTEGQNTFELAREKLHAEHDTTTLYHRLLVRFNLPTHAEDTIFERLKIGLEHANARNDRQECAYCLIKMAELLHYYYLDPEEAIKHYESGIHLYRELDEPAYLAQALSKLGEAYRLLGHVEKNQLLVQESYRIQLEIGDELGASQTMRALGMMTFMAGEYAQSLRFCKDAVDIQKRANFTAGQINNSVYVGILIYFKGDILTGKQMVEDALRMAEEIGLKSALGWSLATLSTFASFEGNYELAGTLLKRAEAIQTNPFQQIGAGDPWLKLTKVWAKVLIAMGQARYKHAKELLHPIWQQACETYSVPYLTLFMPIMSILHARIEPEDLSTAIQLLGLTFAQSGDATGFMHHWQQLSELRDELKSIDENTFNKAWELGQKMELIQASHTLLNAFWNPEKTSSNSA